MDFITGLPPSKHRKYVYDYIFVVVDRYSKGVRYIPVTKKIDAAELADVFHTLSVDMGCLPVLSATEARSLPARFGVLYIIIPK